MGNKKGVILLTYCNQASGYLPYLTDEVRNIKSELDRQEVTAYFDVQNEPISSVDHLRDSISRYKNELVVFSYSGHAEPDELLLDNSAAHGESLMEMLALCPNLKLVLLNGCSTAKLTQKGRELGIPILIGTNCSVPDRDAMHFAVSLFGSLRDKNTTIRSAYDYAKSASRLENLPGANRAGRQSPPSDQIWDSFAVNESFLDKNLYQLCYLPAPVAFVGLQQGGAPKVFFIHTEEGQKSYNEILERAPLENIAVGSISSTFINNNSETIDRDTVRKYWDASDAVCLLVNNVGFTTNFWPKICDQISELQLISSKPMFVSNISIEADYFGSFLKKIGSCNEYPQRELWGAVQNVESLNKNSPGVGYSSLIRWLLKIVSAPVEENLVEIQLNKLNYEDQEFEYKKKKKDPAAHQFILIEGSPHCGHEWLYKRLLKDKTIGFQQTTPQILDFAGQEIQSAEQLWQRLGDRVVRKTNRADIVQEVTNRLQLENIVIVCDNVYNFSHNAEYLQKTRDILNQFWAEWTADFAHISIPNQLVLVVFNRGYNEETSSGKLDLLQKKQGNSDLIVLSPIGLLTKDILEDWHEVHNKVVFSPIAYQILLNKCDDVLLDPHIKNVVHKICAVYECEHICDQLFQL